MIKLTPELLNRLNVPKVHWQASITKVPSSGAKHRKIVSDFCEDLENNLKAGQGLLLFGDYGRGKSALGAVILKAAAVKGKFGLWIRAKELPNLIINDIAFDEEETVMERAENVPLLVIDEFQIRNDIRFGEVAVEDLIRRRIDARKSVVVTTNLTPSQIKDKYPALASVMQDCIYPVKVQGHDFRAEKKGIA